MARVVKFCIGYIKIKGLQKSYDTQLFSENYFY